MTTSNKILLFLFLACLLQSCYEDSGTPEVVSPQFETDPQVVHDTKIVGYITDETNNNLDSYTLVYNSFDGEVTKTIDGNYFSVELKNSFRDHQQIDIYKSGELVAFTNQTLVGYDVNLLDLKIFPEKRSATLGSNTGTVDINDEISLLYEFSDGTSPESAEFFQTDEFDLLCQMGLFGKDKDDNEIVVQANQVFYFNAAELSGTDLTDKLTVVIQYNFSGPDTHGLFVYDEVSQYWKFVSDLVSGENTIPLAQVGYYKTGPYEPASLVRGSLSLENEEVAFQKIEVRENEENIIKVNSTASGKWIAFLPMEKELDSYLINECGEELQGESIPSEEANVSLEIDENFKENFVPATFKIFGCDGNLIENPALIINENGVEKLFEFEGTEVDINIPICFTEYEITAIDPNSDERGISIDWSELIDDDYGIMTSCAQFDNGYSWIRIEDNIKVFEPFSQEVQDENTILRSTNSEFQIKFEGKDLGSQDSTMINIAIDDENFGDAGYLMQCLDTELSCGIDNFYISHYEEANGGLIRISFNGKIFVLDVTLNLAKTAEIEGQILILN